MAECYYCGDKCRKTVVYVIGDGHNGPLFKVGYAADPAKRLKQISDKKGRALHLLHSIAVECEFKAMDIETLAHKLLQDWWDSGEWFYCTFDEAVEAVNKAARRLGTKGKRA